jgi:glycosyltransferase involved in cell wall biosynthesis
LNEARNLPATLANILLARDVEVIVVDGGSKDDTVQIAESFGVKVLSAAANRAVQMNRWCKSSNWGYSPISSCRYSFTCSI